MALSVRLSVPPSVCLSVRVSDLVFQFFSFKFGIWNAYDDLFHIYSGFCQILRFWFFTDFFAYSLWRLRKTRFRTLSSTFFVESLLYFQELFFKWLYRSSSSLRSIRSVWPTLRSKVPTLYVSLFLVWNGSSSDLTKYFIRYFRFSVIITQDLCVFWGLVFANKIGIY